MASEIMFNIKILELRSSEILKSIKAVDEDWYDTNTKAVGMCVISTHRNIGYLVDLR